LVDRTHETVFLLLFSTAGVQCQNPPPFGLPRRLTRTLH
jgi:hypothetical protein